MYMDTTFPPPDGRLAQVMRVLEAFDRDTLAAVIEHSIDRLDALDGDPDIEDDDPLDTGNAEDEGQSTTYANRGPGCPLADDDYDEVHIDFRPIADPAAAKHHLRRIRRTRCRKVIHRSTWPGVLPWATWELLDARSVGFGSASDLLS